MAGVSTPSDPRTLAARDVARAMMRSGGDTHVAAKTLGCDEFDFAERVLSEEVATLIARMREAQRLGRDILSDTAKRHALLVLNAVVMLPHDDPVLSPTERHRRADLVRKTSVDILRHAETLSGGNGGGGKKRGDDRARNREISETPAQRRERIHNAAVDKHERMMEKQLGPEEWDRRQRLSARLKEHGLTFVPQLPNSGWKIDFEHPFCVELARIEPDIIEQFRKDEAADEEEDRRIREIPQFTCPREAMRFYAARDAAEAAAKAKAKVNADANASSDAASAENQYNKHNAHKSQHETTNRNAEDSDDLHRIMAINQCRVSADTPGSERADRGCETAINTLNANTTRNTDTDTTDTDSIEPAKCSSHDCEQFREQDDDESGRPRPPPEKI